jgi:23S rRNA pseudouridine1911/1915/1917 synthase
VSDGQWHIDAIAAGLRLDRFLAADDRLRSRGRVQRALERGKVLVNGVEAVPADAGRRLVVGDHVRVWIDRPGTAHRRGTRAARAGELPIVYEDDAVIVVNKPPGLLAVPLLRRSDAPSVQQELVLHLRSRGRRRPHVVHRIDRDTSGLVVFATRADAQARLREQFSRHEPERVYLAVVYGHPSPASGTWRDHLVWNQDSLIQQETRPGDPRGQVAESRYRVVETFRDASLVEIELVTGKRNQIRLQARLRGHVLVGEQRYVNGPDRARPIAFPRQALHACRLGFRHPVDNRRLRFEAPVPSDLAGLIERLRQGNRALSC